MVRSLLQHNFGLCAVGFFLCSPLLAYGQKTDARESLLPSMERYAHSNHRFTLEGGYAILQLTQKEFSGLLPRLGAAEARWGFSAISPLRNDIAQLDERFAFGSYMRPRWTPGGGLDNEVEGDFWRLGIGIRDGYGYWPGNVIILPYFLWTMNWSKWSPESGNLSKADSAIVARYDRRVCFGLSAESGMKFQVGWHVSIITGFEFGLAYPRFVFPEWVGSFAIVSTAEGLVGVLTSGMIRDAPGFTPIVHAILKAGFAYGYYQLTRSNMHWPFHSETPLTYAGFKIGVSVRF